ncbi:MAG: hypothetical protein RIC57_08525 [Balneola sp.]|tara:strand:+ start:6349 stop:6834 length:486 start_codon:yes stop_codon:yes gene_type:complete
MNILKRAKALILSLIICSTAVAAQNMPMQQIAPADSVSDSELEQFVIIAQELQGIRMELDSLVVAKLEEEGMSTARFQEIMQSKQNPEGEEIELTTKEEETVANMQSFLQQASMSAQKQQMQSIQNAEMSAQRFQSIAQAMQSDKDLAMRMQTMAMEMESN